MRRFFTTVWYKLCAMFGGELMLPLAYLLLAACFAAVAVIVRAKAPERVTVSVVDECGGEYSSDFMRILSGSDGLNVVSCATAEAGQDAMLAGRAEALLVLSEDFDEKLLEEGSSSIVSLQSAPGAVSAELIREAAAGLLAAQRSVVLAEKDLEADGFDAANIREYIDEFESPELYSIEVIGGGSRSAALFGSSYACYEGVAAFAMLLLLLTLARRLADSSSRLVAWRMGAAKGGSALAFAGDLGALFTAALVTGIIAFAFAPVRSPQFALGLACYSLCIAGLCLLTSRFGAAGRIDIAAPVIALITSLIGGCFADIASLSSALAVLAKCTPQGQLIACSQGNMLFAPLLAAEGIALALLSLAVKGKKGY